MNKFFRIFWILLFIPVLLFSQELKCNVQIVTQQIQGTNKQVFETLQTELYEFMNNRIWTNHVFAPEERIECNMLFNITEQLSADEFRGTLQIQSRRPIYNTNYNTVMLNYLDNDIQFSYIEFEPLEFDMNSHISNLTSILAFYAYTILALDYDSFAPEGGEPFWDAAEKIVDNAQNAQEKGWKPFDNSSHRNRYWLVKDFVDPEYAMVRQYLYRYHRLGLDVMDSKVNEGRTEIANSLELLQKVYRQKPDPFLQPLHLIFDAKVDEFVSIFSESFPEEKNRVVEILNEIDQANSNKYKAILESQN
ncbi:MAG: DUF4835 family protein [Bacteroidota bacterium]